MSQGLQRTMIHATGKRTTTHRKLHISSRANMKKWIFRW